MRSAVVLQVLLVGSVLAAFALDTGDFARGAAIITSNREPTSDHRCWLYRASLCVAIARYPAATEILPSITNSPVVQAFSVCIVDGAFVLSVARWVSSAWDNGSLLCSRARSRAPQIHRSGGAEFALRELNSSQDVIDADPDDDAEAVAHCLWASTDKSSGQIRSRSFAPELGAEHQDAAGAAAIRITERLGRSLTITHGKGSVIHARWRPRGWVAIGGGTVRDARLCVT